jgi:hypothetical protein
LAPGEDPARKVWRRAIRARPQPRPHSLRRQLRLRQPRQGPVPENRRTAMITSFRSIGPGFFGPVLKFSFQIKSYVCTALSPGGIRSRNP